MRKVKLFLVSLLIIGIIILGITAIGFKKLSSRKKKRRLEERYYRASNPNWKQKEKPPRMIYREHEDGNSFYKQRYKSNSENSDVQAAFWSIRLILLITLSIGLPFVIFAFAESIKGFVIILLVYVVVDIISRRHGWDKLDYYD